MIPLKNRKSNKFRKTKKRQRGGNQEEKDNTSVGIGKNDNNTEKWNCTVRQRDLILNVLERNNLDPQTANELGVELHGKKMDRLTKLQVSGVITELLNRFGRKKNKGGAQ